MKNISKNCSGLGQKYFDDVKKTLRDELQTLFQLTPVKLGKFFIIAFKQATIEIILVELTSSGMKLLACDAQGLPSENNNSETIVNIIRRFIEQHEISCRDVILSIAESDNVIAQPLMLPVLPKGEILDAAKWKIKEETPFDLNGASLDWCQAREHVDEGGSVCHDYMFVIAEKHTVRQYLSYINQCDLTPISIVVGACNFGHVLKNIKETPKISAVLDIDTYQSNLNVYFENELIFVRRLPISWKRMKQVLSRVIAMEQGSVQLSAKEIEKIKKEFRVPSEQELQNKADTRAAHMMSFLRPHLETLARELKLSFNYFTTNFDLDRPAAFYLTGSGAGLKNLTGYLQKELSIKTKILPVPDGVDMIAVKGTKIRPDWIVNALGAAFGGTATINLLPPEIKMQRMELLHKVSLRFFSIVFGVIFLSMLFMTQYQIGDYHNRLKNAQMHLTVIQTIKGLKDRLNARKVLMRQIQNEQVPVDGLLKTIAVLTPSEVVLDHLAVDQYDDSLVINGTVLANENVAGAILSGYMQQLEASPFFNEASLISSERDGMNQNFEIKCDLVI